MELHFEYLPQAQDMLLVVMKKENISAAEAVKHVVNKSMLQRISQTGWASEAFMRWRHYDPAYKYKLLEKPVFNVSFTKEQLTLIELVMEIENVNVETAIGYFLIFTMDAYGYHI